MKFPKFGGSKEPAEPLTGAALARQTSIATIKREQRVTFAACFLGLVASVGGFMFGYVR